MFRLITPYHTFIKCFLSHPIITPWFSNMMIFLLYSNNTLTLRRVDAGKYERSGYGRNNRSVRNRTPRACRPVQSMDKLPSRLAFLSSRFSLTNAQWPMLLWNQGLVVKEEPFFSALPLSLRASQSNILPTPGNGIVQQWSEVFTLSLCTCLYSWRSWRTPLLHWNACQPLNLVVNTSVVNT